MKESSKELERIMFRDIMDVGIFSVDVEEFRAFC